ANSAGSRIDLLFTDVIMPKMGGKELAERIQTPYPQIKVLYCSGYAEDIIAHQGVLDPGIAFLAKPFTPGGLAAKVREVLDAPAPVKGASRTSNSTLAAHTPPN